MLAKEDSLTKKIGVITGLLVAVTGLIAAWTAFVKVQEPPQEKKAAKAYALLKEQIEFQDMVLKETRNDLRDVQRKLDELKMFMIMSSYGGQPAYGLGPSGDGYDYGMEGAAEEEEPMNELPDPDELTVPDLDKPKLQAPVQKSADPLMAGKKSLPSKL